MTKLGFSSWRWLAHDKVPRSARWPSRSASPRPWAARRRAGPASEAWAPAARAERRAARPRAAARSSTSTARARRRGRGSELVELVVLGSTTSSSSATASGTGGAGGAGGGFTEPMGTADYPAEIEQNNLKSTANALQAGPRASPPRCTRRATSTCSRSTSPRRDARHHHLGRKGGCPAGAKTYVRVFDANGSVVAPTAAPAAAQASRPPSTRRSPGSRRHVLRARRERNSIHPVLRARHQGAAPGCGDGIVQVQAGEQCDDGNIVAGDGCSRRASSRPGTTSTRPSRTTPRRPRTRSTDSRARSERSIPTGDVDYFSFTVTVPGSSVRAAVGDGFGGCPRGSDATLSTSTARGHPCSAGRRRRRRRPCSAAHRPHQHAAGDEPRRRHSTPSQVNAGTAPRQPSYVLDVHVAAPGCGDGILETGEQCDDGNTTAGDGCSPTCQLEKNYIPETEPNDTSALANPLGSAGGFIGAISPAGDHDYFSFDVTTGRLVGDHRDRRRHRRLPGRLRLAGSTLYDPARHPDRAERQRDGVGPARMISPARPRRRRTSPSARTRARRAQRRQHRRRLITCHNRGHAARLRRRRRRRPASSATTATRVAGDGCSPTCQAEPPYEIEPNGSRGHGHPLWSGTTSWKALHQPVGDHDYFTFTLAARGQLTLVTHDIGTPDTLHAPTP